MRKLKFYTALTLISLISHLQNAHAAFVDGSRLWFAMQTQPALFIILSLHLYRHRLIQFWSGRLNQFKPTYNLIYTLKYQC